MNPKRRLRQLRDDSRWSEPDSTTAPARTRPTTGRVGMATTGIAVLIAAAVIIGLWTGLSTLRSTPPAAAPIPTRSATATPTSTLEPIIQPSPVSNRTYPARPRSAGCPANSATVPTKAVIAPIADVDGDGRPDSEWTVYTTSGRYAWGVRTASGAVIRQDLGFASGNERSISIGTLRSGQTVALASDGRSVVLYVLHNCQWINPNNSDFGMGYGEPITDTGAGCINGQLYALSRTPTSDRKEVTYAGRPVHISADATTLTRGAAHVFARLLADDDSNAVRPYAGNTCEPSTRIVPHPANG